MPETLSTPSNTQVKARLLEPYASEGLNKKLMGMVPPGIIRGGRLEASVAPMTVTLQPDPNTGDSVYSYIDANGVQLTFRQVGAINLNLNVGTLPGKTMVIGAQIDYTVSTPTVVRWRAYSIPEITTVPVPEAPYLVIVGQVVIPATGVIPPANVTPLYRRDAWTGISKGVREWENVVYNGSFELAQINTSFAPGIDGCPGFETGGLAGTPFDFSVVRTAPYEGNQHMKITGSGASGSKIMPGLNIVRVREDRLVHVIFALRGVVWGGVGGNGFQGVSLAWYDVDSQALSYTHITDNTLSGTFAWTEIDKIVAVPSGAAWMSYFINIDDDSAAPTGDLYLDVIRVFVESDDKASDVGENGWKRERVIGVKQLNIVPWGPYTDLEDYIRNTLRLFQSGSSSPLQYWLQHALGDQAWDLVLKDGGIKVERWIQDLGEALLGSAANAAIPRMKGNLRAGTSQYTCVMEWNPPTAGFPPLRVFVCEASSMFQLKTVIGLAVNQDWTGTQWSRDDASLSSVFMGIGGGFGSTAFTPALKVHVRKASDASPWADGAALETFSVLFNENTVVPEDGFRVQGPDMQLRFFDNAEYSNLAKTANPPGINTLYSISIIRAWAHMTTTAVAPDVNDSFNVDEVGCSYVGQDLQVDFFEPISDAPVPGSYAQYCVVPSIVGGGAGTNILLSPFDLQITGFKIRAFTADTGVQIDLTSVSVDLCFSVWGRKIAG